MRARGKHVEDKPDQPADRVQGLGVMSKRHRTLTWCTPSVMELQKLARTGERAAAADRDRQKGDRSVGQSGGVLHRAPPLKSRSDRAWQPARRHCQRKKHDFRCQRGYQLAAKPDRVRRRASQTVRWPRLAQQRSSPARCRAQQQLDDRHRRRRRQPVRELATS